MRFFSLILLNLISIYTYSQQEIGIGIVMIEFDSETVVDFYNSPQLSKKLKTIDFFEDESIHSLSIRNLEKQREWLRPESLWIDYSQFIMRCKSKTNDCYEVYVSEGKTMWIKNAVYAIYNTWEEYLKEMFSIQRIDPNEQKIYNSPDKKSKEIEYIGKECFKVKSMKGDWIEIYSSENCFDPINYEYSIKSGWIKWKDGNRILIQYFTTS